MKTFSFLFLLFLLYGCTERATQTDATVIIPSYPFNDLKKPPLPPPSPYSYYGCFNFIVDSTGKLYFYQHFYNRKQKPVRVIDFDKNAPVFINLNPNDIIEIPEDGVKSFLQQNVLNAEPAYRIVRVIGVTDTVKSKVLAPLMQVFNDTTNQIRYSVRMITQEEKVVLDFKKRQEFYSPDSVKWDSSKIWFFNHGKYD